MALVLHAGCVVGAVALTQRLPVEYRPTRVDSLVIYYPPEPASTGPSVPGVEVVGLPPLTDIPNIVLAPEIGVPAFDPAPSRLIARMPSGPGLSGLYAPAVAGGPVVASLADQPPIWLAGAPPIYPEILRGAGLEGDVEIEVVIDTTGRADPRTLRVLRATHPRFVAPARAAILDSRYRPGRVGGTPVPVIIRQTVRFTLD